MGNRNNGEDYMYKNVKKIKKDSKNSVNKNQISRDKGNKNIPKIRDDEFDNPLEDVEILRAMGVHRCISCKTLYPLHLNRCPSCSDS